MDSPTLSTPTPEILPAPEIPVGAATSKWQREYAAFLRLKPELMPTHAGKYVVIHEGEVVDSGTDKIELAMSFFSKHGNVPIHVGLVTNDPEPVVRIPHYREIRS